MGFSLRLVEPTGIEGVLLVPLAHYEDERGYFFESFRQEWMPPGAPAMIQGNVSFSKAGVLRGMHYHKRQADFWVVVAGRARAGLYDLREGSTHSRVQTIELDDRHGLYIPAGVAHGFYAVTDALMTYMVDRVYDATDEHGVKWDDCGIAWGTETPVLSERDRTNPRLVDVAASP